MGYYTAFSLSTYGDPEECEAFEKDLLESTKYSNGEYDCEVQELIDTGGTYAKLYDLEDTIEEIAKNHPNVLVILTGDGEETDDRWEFRCKGKENEKHYATIPPFETPELKTQDELNNN